MVTPWFEEKPCQGGCFCGTVLPFILSFLVKAQHLQKKKKLQKWVQSPVGQDIIMRSIAGSKDDFTLPWGGEGRWEKKSMVATR